MSRDHVGGTGLALDRKAVVGNAVTPLSVDRPRRREAAHTRTFDQPEWLDIARVARLEVSSQQRTHPIDDACSSTGEGWRASEPGEQVIQVLFHSPRSVARIRVVFSETTVDRTQELTLGWSAHRGETHRQIMRQRFNFGRLGAVRATEEYQVELHDVTRLELRIVPDVERGEALASLAELKIA